MAFPSAIRAAFSGFSASIRFAIASTEPSFFEALYAASSLGSEYLVPLYSYRLGPVLIPFSAKALAALASLRTTNSATCFLVKPFAAA